MTQVRYHNYNRPVDSFAENRRTLGMMNAGRYRGFDTFSQGGALDGTLLHTGTGVLKTDVLLAVSDPMGALITPQGGMIYEDAAVVIAGFTSNIGNNGRLDLIICEHEFLAVAGGQAATYSVIEGVPASNPTDIPVAPALTNPEKQVIIGTMFIPGGDANLNNAIYTAGVPNLSNGQGLALLDQQQQFTKMQSLAGGTDNEVDTDKLIKLGDNGNLFICTLNASTVEYMADKPIGTTLKLILKTGSQSVTTFVTELSSAPTGYIPFLLNGDDDIAFADRTILEFTRVSYPFNSWQLVSAGINSFDIKVLASDLADVEAGAMPAGIMTDGTLLKTKVVVIGDWDMDADGYLNVAHGIGDYSKIRRVDIMIINDASNVLLPLDRAASTDGQVDGGINTIGTTVISLKRISGGAFDHVDYNASSFNRGFITITYEA